MFLSRNIFDILSPDVETIAAFFPFSTNASKRDKVDFKSSDESVVTIKDGIITAVSEGNAVVTAVCEGKTDYCYVTVKETATEIANKKITLRTKGANKTAQLDYSIVGKKLNGKWSVKPSGIVTVSKGKLTAKKEGTATVTLEANGKTAAVVVTVLPYEPTISLDKSVVSEDDIEMLEDLILVAYNDAHNKVEALAEEGMKAATGGVNLGGLKFPL